MHLICAFYSVYYIKHVEYEDSAFPLHLYPKGLNPCNNLSLEYQNAHFLVTVLQDKLGALQQGFILGSEKVKHLEIVSKFFIWANNTWGKNVPSALS